MKKLLAIYPFVLCLLAGCAPSNIKVLEISEKPHDKVSVRFSAYKAVKLKKIPGFDYRIYFNVIKLDNLKFDGKQAGWIDFSISNTTLSNAADFYYSIPDCTVMFNQDSTMVFFEGFAKGTQYDVIRQTKEGYILSLYYYSSDDAPVSADEKEFLKKLSLGISIEE